MTILHTWSPGDLIKSADVNGDFAAVETDAQTGITNAAAAKSEADADATDITAINAAVAAAGGWSAIQTAITTTVPANAAAIAAINAKVGAANGLATLDADSHVPLAELPYTAGDGISISGSGEISSSSAGITQDPSISNGQKVLSVPAASTWSQGWTGTTGTPAPSWQDTYRGLLLKIAPPASGTAGCYPILQPMPDPPFTLYARLMPRSPYPQTGPRFGICRYCSNNGYIDALSAIEQGTGAPAIVYPWVERTLWTTAFTTGSAAAANRYSWVRPELWMSLEDDGTNVTLSTSMDGAVWEPLVTYPRLDSLSTGVPDHIGIFCVAQAGFYPTGIGIEQSILVPYFSTTAPS